MSRSAGPLARIAALLCGIGLWHAPSWAEEAQTFAPLDVFQECDVCPEMIVLPLGDFMMGAKPEESRNPVDMFGDTPTMTRRPAGALNIIPHEHPRHRVEMDIPLAMGRNEITHAEWMRCVKDGGCRTTPRHGIPWPGRDLELGPTHPVIYVSYLDIQEYVAWLNARVGAEVYRLPTEAEWEYAAGSGTETRFAQGDDLTADQANFSRQGTEGLRQREFPDLVSRKKPVEVGDLDAANAWGLRHMSGNVSEHTMSCYTPEHLGLATASQYLAHARAHAECQRVSKGGSYGVAMDYLRPSARGYGPEDIGIRSLGFRLVRQLWVSE